MTAAAMSGSSFGKMADRYDKVVLLLCGCLCMSAAVVAIPFVTSFAVMIATYLFLGFGEAVLWPLLGAYAAEEGRDRFGHGTMMGMYNLAMSAGVFAGAVLAGVSMDALGMRRAFWCTGVAIVVLCLIAAYLIRTGEAAGEIKAETRS